MDNRVTIPDWTFTGGFFRSGFSGNDMPTPWTRRRGRWKRDELVPYGKASDDYRSRFYRCPECPAGNLLPSEIEYTFECDNCRLEFRWGFGGLSQQSYEDNRYTPDDQ